ncbi:MAG: 1-acyl-sn-glycerol-3-phosphate acyltransferase [Bacteroidia bacterium]|nr:1-acyl-sn-glycerol-3-phosphate acyltransferase [Bacteroidia bacterium]
MIYSKKFKWPKKAVIVANHSSYLDIAFVPFYCKHTAIFMGKHELLKVPLFKNFFKYMDIPVNRKSISDAHRAYVRAAEELRKNRNIIIFPEGTISPEGKLKPFKDGAFRLAIQEKAPIIPVVYKENWKYLQNGGFLKSRAHGGRPKIFIGEPIVTKFMNEKDADVIKEQIRNFMLKKLEESQWK